MNPVKRKYEVVRNSSTLYFTKQRNQEERMKSPTQIEKLQTVKNQVEAIHLQKRQSHPPHQPPLKKTRLPHSHPQKSQVTLYGEGVEKWLQTPSKWKKVLNQVSKKLIYFWIPYSLYLFLLCYITIDPFCIHLPSAPPFWGEFKVVFDAELLIPGFNFVKVCFFVIPLGKDNFNNLEMPLTQEYKWRGVNCQGNVMKFWEMRYGGGGGDGEGNP